jgi:hypothetical protein
MHCHSLLNMEGKMQKKKGVELLSYVEKIV